MNKQIQNLTFKGMRVLEVWAGKDERRQFEVRWAGPRRAVGATGWTGGYRVAAWVKGTGVKIARLGATLYDAALEVTRAVGDFQ